MSTLKKGQALSAIRHTLSVWEFNADMLDHLTTLMEQAGYPLFDVPDGYRVSIELDTYYEPDGDYDLEQERRSLASGELTAYVVLLEQECQCGSWNVKQSLSGVVVETSNADSYYDELHTIPDIYLKQVACELISEEDA